MQRTAKVVCLAVTLCALALASVTRAVPDSARFVAKPAVVAGDDPKPGGGSG